MLNGLPALRPIKTIEARSPTAVPPGPLCSLVHIRIPGFKRRNAELIPYQGYPYLIFVQGSSSMIIVKKRNETTRTADRDPTEGGREGSTNEKCAKTDETGKTEKGKGKGKGGRTKEGEREQPATSETKRNEKN